MGGDTGKCIVNMLKCPANTHPLFRSFGLGAVTDSTNGISRSGLTVAISRWYPSAQLKEFVVDRAAVDGSFEYSITVNEV